MSGAFMVKPYKIVQIKIILRSEKGEILPPWPGSNFWIIKLHRFNCMGYIKCVTYYLGLKYGDNMWDHMSFSGRLNSKNAGKITKKMI